MSALLDLAWAAMSEQDIVAKVAADCRRRSLRWERGSKGDIRKLVHESRPQRGQKKARLEAVLAEIDRQRSVRDKRDRNKPIDWSKNKPLGDGHCPRGYSVESRRLRIFRYRTGNANYTACSSYIKWHGHHVFVVRDSYWGPRRLYILHPDGGKRLIKLGSSDHNQDTVLNLVLYTLGRRPGLLKQAVMTGASIVPDFCLAQTTVTFPTGRRHVLPWVKPKSEESDDDGKRPHVCARGG